VTTPMKIDTVFSVGLPDEAIAPVSTATAVYRMGTHLMNLHQLGSHGLEALIRAVSGANSYEIRTSSPKNMLAALTEGMHADEAA
jgi:hypothetical protein